MERRTRQREAIQSVFDGHLNPLTPGEIHALALEKMPQVGIATVYRFLRSMMEDGEIVSVEIPGQPPRYERANKGHHHHFVCRVCGKVYELEKCLAGVKKLAPPRFLVEDHEITLYGRCRACRA